MQGLHLTADLYGCRCDASWLRGGSRLQDWLRDALDASGLAAFAQAGSSREDGGTSTCFVLDGSHVTVHTWPGPKTVAVDVYVCNTGGDHSAKARGLMFALVNRFQPEWTEQRSLDRGSDEA